MSQGQSDFEGLNSRLACGRALSVTCSGLVALWASIPKVPGSVRKEIETLRIGPALFNLTMTPPLFSGSCSEGCKLSSLTKGEANLTGCDQNRALNMLVSR